MYITIQQYGAVLLKNIRKEVVNGKPVIMRVRDAYTFGGSVPHLVIFRAYQVTHVPNTKVFQSQNKGGCEVTLLLSL